LYYPNILGDEIFRMTFRCENNVIDKKIDQILLWLEGARRNEEIIQRICQKHRADSLENPIQIHIEMLLVI
jgi:hypothetical protein